MRDLKQVLGVFTLLLALPAWASRMDLSLGPMFLSPVYLLSLVACLVGLFVRSIGVARLWAVLLLLGTVPAGGLLVLFQLFSPSHVDEEHPDMSMVFGLAIVSLVASYAWAFWRIVVTVKQPRGTSEGSQPAARAPR